jgi:hypothetical protein
MRILFLLSLLFVSARAISAAEPASPEAAKLAAKEAELKRLQAEVAELRTKLNVGEPQIDVWVRTFRLRRSALRRSGVDVDRGVLASHFDKPAADGVRHLDAAGFKADDPFLDRLKAWMDDPAKLAEPMVDTRLRTRSKQPVFMNSGGEIPILVPKAMGSTEVEFRRFGTQLDAAPELLDDGRVRLQVRPRSSEIDKSRSVTIAGNRVPALRVAEVDLTVDLTPGEILAVAGLIQTRELKVGYEEIELLTLVSVEIVPASGARHLMSTPADRSFGRAAVGDSANGSEAIVRTSAEAPVDGTTNGASTRSMTKQPSKQAPAPANRRPGLLPRRGRL